MPVLKRDTIVDRPVLVDREDQENKEQSSENDEEDKEVEVLGEGGGPVINGIEFSEGHYNIVAASNMAGILATGREEGEAFEQSFRNAAIQLYELQEKNQSIRDLVRFSVEKGVSEIGISESQIEELEKTNEETDEDVEEAETMSETVDEENDEETDKVDDDEDVDEIEESIDEIKEDKDEEG